MTAGDSLLSEVTRLIVLGIQVLALALIAFGTIEALVRGIKIALRHPDAHSMRTVWIAYSQYLVAGLTLQLGADIVQTSIAPSWDEIGRLGAIAAIRTFLSYFLERDQREVRSLQSEQSEPG